LVSQEEQAVAKAARLVDMHAALRALAANLMPRPERGGRRGASSMDALEL
jgi:hypothetical protein